MALKVFWCAKFSIDSCEMCLVRNKFKSKIACVVYRLLSGNNDTISVSSVWFFHYLTINLVDSAVATTANANNETNKEIICIHPLVLQLFSSEIVSQHRVSVFYFHSNLFCRHHHRRRRFRRVAVIYCCCYFRCPYSWFHSMFLFLLLLLFISYLFACWLFLLFLFILMLPFSFPPFSIPEKKVNNLYFFFVLFNFSGRFTLLIFFHRRHHQTFIIRPFSLLLFVSNHHNRMMNETKRKKISTKRRERKKTIE